MQMAQINNRREIDTTQHQSKRGRKGKRIAPCGRESGRQP